jgi:hypothetical protein
MEVPDLANPDAGVTPKKELSLFDSTCIIVGIIIGAGIYQMAPDIAKGAASWWGVLVIWAVGGLISLFGALGYAELATAYPKEGGDYVYLSRAYGPWAGFLFGWGQLAIIRPGDIAVMAFACATYARRIYDPLAAYPEYSQRAAGSQHQARLPDKFIRSGEMVNGVDAAYQTERCRREGQRLGASAVSRNGNPALATGRNTEL